MIVGLGNVARVGKDESALALVRELGFTRIGFADALKGFALDVNPVIIHNAVTNVGVGSGKLKQLVSANGWEYVKDRHSIAREFLQNLGLSARQWFGEDIWIETLERQVAKHDHVVIPDVRFKNEAEWVKAHGGKLIRIDRPGHVGKGHVSETELADYDGWDAVLSNDAGLDELHRKVVDTVRPWLAVKEKKTREVAEKQ